MTKEKKNKRPALPLESTLLRWGVIAFIVYFIVSTEWGKAPDQDQGSVDDIVVEKQNDAASQVDIAILKTGEGPIAGCGDDVTVKHTVTATEGATLQDGDTSFTLGTNSVIKGLEMAVEGMQKGEVRQVLIPPELTIHPTDGSSLDPLEVTVELLKLQKRPENALRCGSQALEEALPEAEEGASGNEEPLTGDRVGQ